jgi:hypothetical protein
MDIGAYRDMHRHRRCHQYRQAYSGHLGYATPKAIHDAGLASRYDAAMQANQESHGEVTRTGAHYLLPFGARSRFLFKMDFAEAEYISRLRSGVKGHFSYRDVAWQMKVKMEELEPALGKLIEATPPWFEDPPTPLETLILQASCPPTCPGYPSQGQTPHRPRPWIYFPLDETVSQTGGSATRCARSPSLIVHQTSPAIQ